MARARSDDFCGGDFGDENFAAFHLFETVDDKMHALFEGEPKTGHALIGDGQFAAGAHLEKERYDRAATADHVPVADAGIARGLPAG